MSDSVPKANSHSLKASYEQGYTVWSPGILSKSNKMIR